MRHFFIKFISIVLLKSVVFAKSTDNFSIEDRFQEESFTSEPINDPFKKIKVKQSTHKSLPSADNFSVKDRFREKNFTSKSINDSFKATKMLKSKILPVLKNKLKPKLVADVQNALWSGTESERKINTDVLDSETFYDIFIANQCIYQSTKRYKENKFLFPQNTSTNPNLEDCSPAFKKLKERNIKIAGFISGIQGAANIKESSIIGIIAYKEVVKNEQREIRVFVIEECSQAEAFQFLEGIGGASWMTNFNAKKIPVNPQKLEIPNHYLSDKGDLLYFHEGFYNKIISSKSSTEKCFKNFFKQLGIKNFEMIKSDLNLDETITGLTLKKRIDEYNKCNIKLYIWGYSQGGGLIQIAAPYLTCWVGKYLYGDAFDNKLFNMAHAIGFAPARAIGDANTLKVVENVMGAHNILGYCSYADAVPCLPLGSNIGYDPVKKHGMKLLQHVGKAISLVLKDPYKSFLKTVCGAENFYETLNVWAYEDPFYLIEHYCSLNAQKINNYISCLNKNDILPIACLQNAKTNVKKLKGSETKNAKKILKRLQKTKKNIAKIKKCFGSVQENYFKAHTSNTKKSNWYAGKAIAHLTKMLTYINIIDFVAPQHFATYDFLKFKENGKTYITSLELGFNEDLLKRNLQAAINLGVEYHKKKAEKVKKK